MVSEFRALRASVLRLWAADAGAWEPEDVEEVTRFSESIDQALAESVAAYSAKIDESRDTFLAVLGHDLRGPLATLSNCVQLQGGAAQTPDARDRVLHMAARSVASMEEMITDLLEYTKTRLGRGMEVSPRPGNLDALCEEIVEEARAAHPRTSFEYEGCGQVVAEFDHARIHQVLVNLLNNAVQHGDGGSPVVLTLSDEKDKVCLVVRNHGDPIPPEALQVIFNPLVQVPKAKSEPHERPSTSLGLGLYIAREVVLAHGGTIEVSSTSRGGHCIYGSTPEATRVNVRPLADCQASASDRRLGSRCPGCVGPWWPERDAAALEASVRSDGGRPNLKSGKSSAGSESIYEPKRRHR